MFVHNSIQFTHVVKLKYVHWSRAWHVKLHVSLCHMINNQCINTYEMPNMMQQTLLSQFEFKQGYDN